MVKPKDSQTRENARMRVPGSARVSRAGVGVPPPRTSDVRPAHKRASVLGGARASCPQSSAFCRRHLGSARVSRAGVGVPPPRTSDVRPAHKRASLLGGARASCRRHLESASHQVSCFRLDLPLTVASVSVAVCSRRHDADTGGQDARAPRDQHARRVRSPEIAIRTLCELFSLDGQSNLNLFWKA